MPNATSAVIGTLLVIKQRGIGYAISEIGEMKIGSVQFIYESTGDRSLRYVDECSW